VVFLEKQVEDFCMFEGLYSSKYEVESSDCAVACFEAISHLNVEFLSNV
jgi:hypothetical protein